MFRKLYQNLYLKQFLSIGILLLFSFNLYAKCYDSVNFNTNVKYSKDFDSFSYVNKDANKKGIFRQYVLGTFSTLNPYGVIGILPKDYYTYYFDSLMFAPDDDINSFYPLIASSVCFNDNEIIFYLNKKSKWNNGKDITVEDIKYTFEFLKSSEISYYRDSLKNIIAIEVLDNKSIKFILKEFKKETFNIIASLPILNKEYWSGRDFLKADMEIPVSSGAYKIAEIKQGEKIVLIKDNNYWAKDLPTRVGYFNFAKMIYYYGGAKEKEDLLLQQGEIDFKRESDYKKWNRLYSKGYLKEYNLKKIEIQHNRIMEFRGFFFNLKNKNLQDLKLRKAIALVYDFNVVNQGIFSNFYNRSRSLFENSSFSGDNREQLYSYNSYKEMKEALEQSDKLLKEAGFEVIEGRRINSKTKEQLALNIVFKDKESLNVNIGLINNLRQLGITVNAKSYDKNFYNKIKEKKEYDIIEASYLFSNPPSQELQYYFSKDYSFNYSSIDSSIVNAMIDNILIEKDNKKRQNYTKSLDEYLFKNYYFIAQYYEPYDRYIYSDKLDAPIVTPLGFNIFIWSFK